MVGGVKKWLLPPIAAVTLTACPPPIYPKHVGDYDLAFAKSYFGSIRGRDGPDASGYTLEQQYALYRFARERIHHPPRTGTNLVERGAETASFLRGKLEQAQNGRAVDAILSLLRAMQREGTYDARSDPAYIALIQREAAEHDDKYGRLRDVADDIETDTELPSVIGGWLEPLFTGSDADFEEDWAEEYCQHCDYRETVREADRLPIDKLYALQRFNWDREWPRNLNRYMARRGPEAAAFYKAKLSGKTSGEMLWVILSTLELMRDLGTYDVPGDAEMMRLAEAAVGRLKGWRKAETEEILARLRSGARHPFLKVEER